MLSVVMFSLHALAGQAAAPSVNPVPEAAEFALRPNWSPRSGPGLKLWIERPPAAFRLQGPAVDCTLKVVVARPDVDPDFIRPSAPGVDSEMIRESRCSR